MNSMNDSESIGEISMFFLRSSFDKWDCDNVEMCSGSKRDMLLCDRSIYSNILHVDNIIKGNEDILFSLKMSTFKFFNFNKSTFCRLFFAKHSHCRLLMTFKMCAGRSQKLLFFKESFWRLTKLISSSGKLDNPILSNHSSCKFTILQKLGGRKVNGLWLRLRNFSVFESK